MTEFILANRPLQELAIEEDDCRRCPLWKEATQAVPGEGKATSTIMLVGEQPGDSEDRQGKPFVGPAGKMLDRAMADAGVRRGEVYLTNSVKHFKHEMRGKRRLHKRPNAYEIDRCKWWLDREIAIVKPKLVMALGATAYRSLAGRPGRISQLRGKLLEDVAEVPVMVTAHPSYLLRLRGGGRDTAYERFVEDLRMARRQAADG